MRLVQKLRSSVIPADAHYPALLQLWALSFASVSSGLSADLSICLDSHVHPLALFSSF